MFRWLTDQYPDILNRQLIEHNGLSALGPVDNLYLDMNGIIHPCTHGNNQDEIVLLDETAMLKKIFLYVDRLYKLVQPSQVLYLAVDGVAPRAKMNQQRSRRFRSAKEAEQLESELLARSNQKMSMSDNPSNIQKFDSNCITPGTDFMLKLSLALQKWVAYKLETDLEWKGGATVIVSGPDVPGEGEHKVMDFIREGQAGQNEYYQKNQTHVLYGLDADLIMLGLVTHEPQFLLLREKMSVVMAGRGRNKHRQKKDMLDYDANDFEILELKLLRQMLAIQFRPFAEQLDAGVYSLERVIDDFVFTCMAVGNDFLPHAPHLEIDAGALQLMMSTYIDLVPEWGGYLTKREAIHPQRLEEFLYRLAIYEEEHFKRRGYEENEPGWKLTADAEEDEENDFYGDFYSGAPTPACAAGANRKDGVAPPAEERPMAPTGNRSFRRQHPNDYSRSYRDFYYSSKLGWKVEDRSRTLFRRREHVREYLEGLHWNLNYYHNGCQSWDWFFPYMYAPLVTDMVNLHEFYDTVDEEGFGTFTFEKGTPFDSLAQLLSVLPPQSAQLLPKPLGELMMHPSSPLTHYYPSEFESDPNGKRQSWEAVVQIPFIDSDILQDTVQQILDADANGKNLLTAAERRRNVRGQAHTFVPPGLTEEEQEKLQEMRQRVVAGRMPPRRSSSNNNNNNNENRNGRRGPAGQDGGKGRAPSKGRRKRVAEQ